MTKCVMPAGDRMNKAFSPAKFAPILVTWFLKNHRHLPWRALDLQAQRDPYMVWISETMLQQTRVEAVIAHFLGWMRELPTLAHLAEADETTVLRLWQGLGYYSRARNLQKGARFVMASFDGIIPSDPTELKRIPGIGEYTAGAIASIAYHQKAAILDGNLVRLFARWNLWKHLPTESKAWKQKYWEMAQQFIDNEHPHLINEALMEFGAKVCTPKSPRCAECPLQSMCPAFAKGLQEALPPKKPKKEEVEICASIYRIGNETHLLATRSPQGFLKNQWRLPFAEDTQDLKPIFAPLKVGKAKHVGEIKHTITHHRFTIQVKDLLLAPPALPKEGEWAWFTRKEFRKMVANALSVKALELV